MSDNRKISEEYTEIGNELIQMMPELKELKESDVQIIFLASDAEKKSGGKPTWYIKCACGMEMAETVRIGNKKEQDKIQNKLIKEWNRQ